MTDEEFDHLYRSYGYLVQRRCRSILRDEAEVDEALQEVFFRAYRHLRPDRHGQPLAWLYATANRYCCDVARKRRRHQRLSTQLAAPGATTPGEDADRRSFLRWVLGRLDSRTGEIGILHYLDGLTQEQVAQATGYSRRTVGKKLQQFEAMFRDLAIEGGLTGE